MALFKAYDPKVEVSGESVISFIEGVGFYAPSAQKMLSEYGISDPKPGQWYSQQAWLDAFRTIAGSSHISMVSSLLQKGQAQWY